MGMRQTLATPHDRSVRLHTGKGGLRPYSVRDIGGLFNGLARMGRGMISALETS